MWLGVNKGMPMRSGVLKGTPHVVGHKQGMPHVVGGKEGHAPCRMTSPAKPLCLLTFMEITTCCINIGVNVAGWLPLLVRHIIRFITVACV